ncbi:MAG: LacI family DNA-binding transcriptional regulator [Planctomycetota bacterium]
MAPSVRDIAKQAGVSITTVSRALNSHPDISPKTRERVMKTADRVGYAVKHARPAATGTAIAYVNASGGRLNSAYDQDLLYGMQEYLLQHQGVDLVLTDLRDKKPDETYAQFFESKSVRSVVLRTGTQHRGVCEAIAAEGVPVLVVAEQFENPEMSYVVCESRTASQRGVEHLIHLGHERIALVIHRRNDGDHADREAGYHAAHAAHGLTPDPELTIRLVPNFASGGNALNQLLSLPNPPTAVFFTDPDPATGAMCRAHAVGLKVPDEISILGFDDFGSRHGMFPAITAVCQNTRELGSDTARYAMALAEQPGTSPIRKVTSAFLEINQTTGSVPGTPVRIMPNGNRLT